MHCSSSTAHSVPSQYRRGHRSFHKLESAYSRVQASGSQPPPLSAWHKAVPACKESWVKFDSSCRETAAIPLCELFRSSLDLAGLRAVQALDGACLLHQKTSGEMDCLHGTLHLLKQAISSPRHSVQVMPEIETVPPSPLPEMSGLDRIPINSCIFLPR